ncbi:IS110 family transposase [Devosia sp. SD17-2]|uniref:IS110 family transposase n=1 Tax=Devosia sp. SD17-2 TaxID=2976459 RepID=UPI0023D82E7A|nr:IS110 family transposase [Devosia sp. SD17-2]WEJ31469.1 IS110 family transposase [Devosia sp. SD17-2]WEJ31602.1 IS110 family transposase [Devosia sp. SD17-2]WEJ32512.1 IS110 family transposase [Devosia sp. SD17-2]WEJ32641.1 IS110 family transposase [Devosia sp. SD17-2]WEJ33430.1 IS110 family transposase [Devosia sp. SD17-2]
MIHDTLFVGIDVSKTHLDVHTHPAGKSWRCSTGPEALAELTQRLARLGPLAIGLEASGGYEARVAESLHAAGLEVHVLAPARIRSYARGIGQLAKTDKIDAALIARYLQAVRASLTPYVSDPIRQRLSAFTAHRRRIVAEKSGLVSQLDTIDEPLVRSLIEERLAAIALEIKRIEAAITALLADNRQLQQRQARLRQVTGVGPVLAIALLADMPELGKVSAKVAAALIGVAPYARQSGASDRNGRCLGGRKHLRDIAYMAVLSAIKVKDPVLGDFYQRLRLRGKPFKLAMIATVRKLITILNAIARQEPAFQQ